MSADTTEKKPKKTVTKKRPSVEEKPIVAVKEVRAQSPSKATVARAENDAPSSSSSRVPTHKEVSSLAHRLFEQRGGQHGSHEQDWFRAEQELAKIS